MRKRTGSIDPTRDGRQRLRMTIRGVRKTVGFFDTEEEAEQVRAATLEELADFDDGVTLLDYGNAWLDRREIGKEVRDPDSDRGRWDNHIANTSLAKLAVPRWKRRHTLFWLREFQKKGLARQTVINTLNVLRGIVRSAMDEELLKESPVLEIRVPREKRTEDAWTFLKPEQQTALLGAIPSPERLLVQFAFWSGLRAGELVCLRAADVGDEVVTVRYGTPPDVPTKGGRVRRVPILPGARAALDAWRAQLTVYATENPHGLVFPRRRGGFRDPNHVLRWDMWDGARKAIGWTGHWHDLRHTCGASLVRGWWGRRWSLEEVKEMLGHESITTTERYAHLADDILGEAARATSIGHQLVARASEALEKKTMKPAENKRNARGAPGKNRTCDLRFRKPPVVPMGPHGCRDCDQLATETLRAFANGDPRASSLAVDLAVAVLESRASETEEVC